MLLNVLRVVDCSNLYSVLASIKYEIEFGLIHLAIQRFASIRMSVEGA